MEKDGTISFVYNDKATGDPFKQPNRISLKPTKILSKIVLNPNEYLDTNKVTQRDIELFSNAWKALLSNEITIEEWEGDKILNAFNYNDEINKSKFSFSCANFNVPGNGWPEPNKKWYDIYTKNPKNIKAIVALKGGKLVGRRILIEGEQYFDDGIFKKGEFYSLINPFYGEGGGGSTIDQKIIEYVKINRNKPYNNIYNNICELNNKSVNGRIIVQLQKTDFAKYAAFDTVYINNENRLIMSNKPYKDHDLKWVKAYKAGHAGINRV